VAGNPRIDDLRKKLDKDPGSRLFAQLAEELRKDGDLEDAIQVAQWYERRWGQEDWHKGLKTGCGVEDLQFTSVARLEPMIMILSAVAGWLLQLRDAGRAEDAATHPASEIVPAEALETLHLWRHPQKTVPADWSIRDFTLALGRLGGHQNRRSDGMPGWITLWRGFNKLHLILRGAAAINNKCG